MRGNLSVTSTLVPQIRNAENKQENRGGKPTERAGNQYLAIIVYPADTHFSVNLFGNNF